MGAYRTLVLQCLGLAACVALMAVLAPAGARVWVIACGLCALGFFGVVSILRHWEIKRLSRQINEVLHNGRCLDLSTYHEGDVAVLSNELAKMVARLDRANRLLATERNALADALADVSHQIRTPLTAAALMLPKIERASDAEERRQATRQLEDVLERVSWLVTSLLKIAKVDAGAIHVECDTVSVAQIVERAAAPLMPAMDLHDVSLVVQVAEGASFQGDARWTTEALENVLKNCMEHTPAGGTVRLQACEDALACRITVTDSGPGIAAEDLPHIFERFYRGRSGVPYGERGSAQGFGIGLALARALISAQGGALSAANAPSGGAQFSIAFPKLTV